jgi:hypothetical protein
MKWLQHALLAFTNRLDSSQFLAIRDARKIVAKRMKTEVLLESSKSRVRSLERFCFDLTLILCAAEIHSQWSEKTFEK